MPVCSNGSVIALCPEPSTSLPVCTVGRSYSDYYFLFLFDKKFNYFLNKSLKKLLVPFYGQIAQMDGL